MLPEKLEIYLKYVEYVSTAFSLSCHVFDVLDRKLYPEDKSYCGDCCHMGNCGECVRENVFLYGSYEADRWSGRYIFYCPAGYIFIATSLDEKDRFTKDTLITGPIQMIDNEQHVPARTDCDPVTMTTATVGAVSEIVAAVCGYAASQPVTVVTRSEQQSSLHNIMYSLIKNDAAQYPIENEAQLQRYIAAGDKSGSQEMLNNLLGAIYFKSGGDFNVIKARVVELVVLLSRASIEGGAQVDEIFWLNNEYMQQIDKITRIDDLNVWLSEVMHRFISYVFDFETVKHTDVIYKAIEYIKAHLTEKITLNDISDYVYLSRSYLSRIFKQEMSCSLTAYISRLRIEKSKELLLDNKINIVDIAYMVGFEDQSYFTKVFKQLCGVSPGKYRGQRGRL